MVAVSMGNEDVRELLVAGLGPVDYGMRLLTGERRIDQNRVSATVNQRGRQWRPHGTVPVGERLVVLRDGSGDEDVIAEIGRHVGSALSVFAFRGRCAVSQQDARNRPSHVATWRSITYSS